MTEQELRSERPVVVSAHASSRTAASGSPLGGGPRGNELLTTANGAILIVLLAALGVTILFIGQLIYEHLFLGLALLGPLALKLASTGYRFVHFYRGDREYVRKGPPPILLRMLAPAVIALTLVVFGSGVALLYTRPAAREPFLVAHKASFVLWLAFMGAHVLGHLPEVLRMLRSGPSDGRHPAGRAGRAIALSSAIVGGLVLALALVPQFSAWTTWMAHRIASG
jgi:hypothetical protein